MKPVVKIINWLEYLSIKNFNKYKPKKAPIIAPDKKKVRKFAPRVEIPFNVVSYMPIINNIAAPLIPGKIIAPPAIIPENKTRVLLGLTDFVIGIKNMLKPTIKPNKNNIANLKFNFASINNLMQKINIKPKNIDSTSFPFLTISELNKFEKINIVVNALIIKLSSKL